MAINLRNLSHRVVVTVIGASLGFAAAAMSDDAFAAGAVCKPQARLCPNKNLVGLWKKNNCKPCSTVPACRTVITQCPVLTPAPAPVVPVEPGAGGGPSQGGSDGGAFGLNSGDASGRDRGLGGGSDLFADLVIVGD